jgi:TfoX/Sxy family transcriptional regulator of competence genes
MKLPKPSPAVIEALARVSARMSGIEHRRMFGFPALFINGTMLAGVMGEAIVVRLPEADRQRLIERGEAAPSMAMGRVMREWVNLAPSVIASDAMLGEWLEKARAHTASLPPKPKKTARGKD